jgi:hypothetical protein
MPTIRQVLQWTVSRISEPSTQVAIGSALGLFGFNVGDGTIETVLDSFAGIALAFGFITPESTTSPPKS